MKFIFSKTQPNNSNMATASFFYEDNFKIRELKDGRTEIVVGVGDKDLFNRRKLIYAVRMIIFHAKANRIENLALEWAHILKYAKCAGVLGEEFAEILATNFEMANFAFVKLKTKPKNGWDFVNSVTVYGDISTSERSGFNKGKIIGEGVNECRVLSNTPGGDMTPQDLARSARVVGRKSGVSVKVLGDREIALEKMGGIIGVSRGSCEKPSFIIMKYSGGDAKEKPIVLIGKGVTFDTGGVNLKPGDSMGEMHMDMSGGSAVIHAISVVAKLKLKKNVYALIPAVENMPSGSSYRPGDVLRSMSGKTIEVLNTDAEGRIILADALHYARRYDPSIVVDVATLTGAALVALGQRASALFANNESLMRDIEKWGEESGDYVWGLPLWDEYDEDIKGTFGDVANIGKSKYGGAITAAAFLKQFVGKFPWAHIDIAPRMTAVEGEYLSKGAAGAPVRLLVKLVEKYVE